MPLDSVSATMIPPSRTGAALFFDVLTDLGVEYLFGHTGGAVIPLHVELNRRMSRREPVPSFVLFRQEGGAGHAAEGYARASGRVGVALATSGPGATNLTTPIADAYKDSIPTVFITGQVPSLRHRVRCLPGGRHRRRNAPHLQAQLSGQGRRGPGVGPARGLSLLPDPAGPGR